MRIIIANIISEKEKTINNMNVGKQEYEQGCYKRTEGKCTAKVVAMEII